MGLTPSVRTSFAAFIEDESHFALILNPGENGELQCLPPLFRQGTAFQTSLSKLESILTTTISCYLIIRREKTLIFATYVPYRANGKERASFLENRQACVYELGEKHFITSIICKEVGEITDARSWEERDAERHLDHAVVDYSDDHKAHEMIGNTQEHALDAGYKKNKCRLCDRRMKNKISPDVSDALAELHVPGTAVQMAVETSTEILKLRYTKKNLAIPNVAATLPADTPSFTFYRHPSLRILYFIFHSPDSAPVQERMIHTMAIPGLVNIHAKEHGVHVDRKIEIHDPEDLIFEAKDERAGKFRSMYLRNGFEGTESKYDTLEADKAFYDAVR